MGVGTSIFLVAVGAVMRYGITLNSNSSGVNIHTIGVILMIVGGIGFLLSLIFWSSWGGVGGRRRVYEEEL